MFNRDGQRAMNLGHRIEEHADLWPERVALFFGDSTTSYAELNQTVSRLANGLRSLGVTPGDRVGVMLPNWPEFHICSHAAWKIGAVEVPINVMYVVDEVEFILANAGVKTVFASAAGAEIIVGIRDRLPDLEAVVLVGDGAVVGTTSFSDLVSNSDPQCLAVELGGNELAVIAYTSGTTGFPKGAMLTHDNLVTSIETLREYLALTDQDNILQVLPCFHSNASLIGVLFAWYLGSSAILLERFDSTFTEVVTRRRPSFFAGVPTVLFDLANLPANEDLDFSSVRYVMFGAAATPPNVRRTVEERFGLRMLQAYGMTEAPNVVTVDPKVGEIDYEGVGLPLAHLAIKIVDGNDNQLSTGSVGEICVGPMTEGPLANLYKPMAGYWKNPEASKKALQGGFFHTGDLGMVDDSGVVRLVDRMKDMIIRGGNNIFPAELERVLVADARVGEAYVVGVPHERLGEVPKAFVVLEEGTSASEGELKELIVGRLARFKRLEFVEFVDRDSLPRTALGKVLKRELV